MNLKLTFYSIATVCFIAFVPFACSRNTDETLNPETPPVSKVKKHLLNFYSTTLNGGAYAAMQLDSAGRISAFGSQSNPGYKVFYKNDTIHYVLGPVSSFNGMASRQSWIFLYGPDKKCMKVLTKGINDGNYTDVADNNPYFYTVNDGNDAFSDSLIYSPTGQIAEIWTASGSNTYLCSKFFYSDPSQKTPSEIIDYTGVGLDFAQYQPYYRTVLTYTEAEQPARRQLAFLAFLKIRVPVTPTSPATPSSRFLALLDKAIKKYSFSDYNTPPYLYNSQNFLYGYNTDSTQYDGHCDPDDMMFERFQYRFTVKEF